MWPLRAGWSEPAHQYAQALQGAPPAGTNWRGVAMQLVDLPQVDHDLQRWTS